jgi:hypothetical protein
MDDKTSPLVLAAHMSEFYAGRVFKEVELQEPIRYAAGDNIEAWLNDLLCLNAADHIPRITGRSVAHGLFFTGENSGFKVGWSRPWSSICQRGQVGHVRPIGSACDRTT